VKWDVNVETGRGGNHKKERNKRGVQSYSEIKDGANVIHEGVNLKREKRVILDSKDTYPT